MNAARSTLKPVSRDVHRLRRTAAELAESLINGNISTVVDEIINYPILEMAYLTIATFEKLTPDGKRILREAIERRI